MSNKEVKIELSNSRKAIQMFDTPGRRNNSQKKTQDKAVAEYQTTYQQFLGPVDQHLFLRRQTSNPDIENDNYGGNKNSSDSHQKFVTCGFSTGESSMIDGAASDNKAMNIKNHNSNFSMGIRRKSQGLENKGIYKSTQKFQSKQGRIIADYLPQIQGAERSENATTISQNNYNSTRLDSEIGAAEPKIMNRKQPKITCQPPLRLLLNDKQIQPLSCPISFDNQIANPVTPTKKATIEQSGEEQLLEDTDSDQKDGDSDDSNDTEEDQSDPDIIEDAAFLAQKKKDAKLQELKDFADANGFNLKVDIKKVPKYGVDEEKIVFTQEFLDQLEKEDDARFMEKMKKFIPPPLEILKKQFTNVEPVRTGFNQGLLPIKIKNNVEYGRTPQGPQIVVNFMTQVKQRESNSAISDRTGRSINKRRPESKESTLSRQNSAYKESRGGRAGSTSKERSAVGAVEGDHQAQDDGTEKEEVKQVTKEAFINSETSLRHLFYLEYKRTFVDGSLNPIVFSKFGKRSYDSNEKFDNNNFNQLIRTCNLKKILRLQNHIAAKGERKFSEPISFPSCDYYKPKDQHDKTLVFESRFESGNLQLVHKKSDNEYDLVLQNDINSKGHTQWFYFRVANVKKGMRVKFNMLNMIKPKSLYNEGMKVLSYSEKRQEEAGEDVEKTGWTRGGDDMSYFQNNYRREHQTNFQRCYYTFTFTNTFEYDEDTVYFSYSQPYTYSDLTEYLCEIQSKQLNYVSRNTLCRTIAGNKCEYLTITNRVPYEIDKKKEGVVISARIHPGESNASWMMKGVLDFLISDDKQASELRDKFVFKIIPMLNPDGVINGNYRCSLAGCDLNRRWKYPSEVLHPTVYNTKKLILKLSQERPLALYCDIHGHSRRKNIFFYGNGSYENPNQSRVFPFLMSKIAQPHFSYDYSRFSMCRSKEQTARIAVWRDLGSKHSNIYTMEASFCGPKPVKFEPHRGKQKPPTSQELNYHFNTQDYLEVGQSLCKTLLLYRQEQESTMGFQNIEYIIEQYHIEKEAKLEQEELIRQQKAITEQRKIQQFNNRTRFNSNSFGENFDGNVRSSQNMRDSSVQKQQPGGQGQVTCSETKKKVTKAKISNNLGEDSITSSAMKDKEKDNKKDKDESASKVKYTYKEALSDDEQGGEESDSEPSGDNLDDDEIMRLIPKKFGKYKYIKGVQEKKKKPVPEPEKKVVKNKPKTQLMPCMVSAKKERDANKESQRNSSQSTAKKNFSSAVKSVVSTLKKGGKQRDVGTHIKYTGDGNNLSLMELDILKHTGCKWSKIIFPGYKGISRFHENYMSAERFQLDSKYRSTTQQMMNQLTSPNKGTQQFMASFNKEFNQLLDGGGLRNSRKASETINCHNLNEINTYLLKQSQSAIKKQNENPPFQNEFILKAAQEAQQKQTSGQKNYTSAIDALQSKIMETNFTEPRSLFGGSCKTPQDTNRCNSSSKKRKLMGLPTHDINEGIKKFDLGDLETVHEKVNNKESMTIEIGKQKSIKKNSAITQGQNNSVTKKVVNGGIIQAITTTGPIKIKNDNGVKLRNPISTQQNSAQKPVTKVGISTTTSASKHKHAESRSSFTNVAQQILSQSIEGSFQNEILKFRDREMTIENTPDYSQLANIAPSQMAQQMMKMQHKNEQRNSQLSNHKTHKINARELSLQK